jgi:heavy metal efflux system protein
MLHRLIALCLTQRLLVLVLAALLTASGLFALRDLPIDAFPDVSSTQVKIIMKAPGMTPEEVESRITVVIEQELLGIPNQTVLRSSSKYAIADITVDFADGTDIYWARQQVNERLGNALKDLPATASGGMAPITTPLGEVFMFTIEGPQSLIDKRTLLDAVIRPQLRAITGVADVNALGGLVKSLEVVPQPAALAARGITLAQLHTALETNNRSDGAGRLSVDTQALLVRASGNITSVADVQSVVVHQRGGQVVRVGDVAEVRVGSLTRYGTVTQDGQGDTVEGLVLALRGANARALVAQVRDKLAQIEKTLPAGTTLKTFYDRGHLVTRAVGTVTQALGEAIALVLVLLLVFLGNLRAALVVAVVLPLSALATFVLMRQFGLSANLMSLGGLAIAIGMLVDAAVVVVENIEETLRTKTQTPVTPHAAVILEAVKEVAVPVTAGIAIIITVFLPLLTLQGLEGKLFTPVALTIVFALAGSLLLSLTVIPVLASLLLGQASHPTPWLVRHLDRLYHRVLTVTLAHHRPVYGAALALLLVTAGVYPLIGTSFMPNLDEGDIIVQTEKQPSINLDAAAAADTAIQKRLLSTVPEITSIVARAGSDELGLDPMGPNDTDTFLVLKPRDQWRSPDKEKLVDAIRTQLRDFPGINFSFTQPIEMRTSEMLSGVRGDVAVKIFGPNTAELDRLANTTVALLQTITGNEDVQTVKNEGVQYLQVDLNRHSIGRLGLSVEEVQNALKSLVEGRSAGVVIDNGRRIPLLVRGPEGLRMSDALFNQLRIPLADGDAIALSSIATLKMQNGPVKIDRENSSRMVVIRANVRGRDLVGFVAEAQAAFATQIKLPPSYRATWGGQFENQQRAAARLAVVVPIALVLIFLLLFTTLGTVRQAVLVLVNIPFALVGGVLALWVSGEYLSVPASVGFIALMGIAVLNGLVMISTFNQLHHQGMAMAVLVVEGARRRLRPVLMTASITGFGLIPLLLATGPGSEIQRPLAIVVVGGLVSATLLTLVLLPSLFRRFGFSK